MDTLRGTFDSSESADPYELDGRAEGDDRAADDRSEADESAGTSQAGDPSRHGIGTDERRMQVRAYNHWASLLGERTFPDIDDLQFDELPDFGPYTVLLDFTNGVDNPQVPFIGRRLGAECGVDHEVDSLSDVPPRSLLSRITDHYMQIMANQAPIGFEAEFVNQAGASILYRGILLPFSSDDETIDFICGVINWKEVAKAATANELLLQIDQALEGEEDAEAGADDFENQPIRQIDPVTEWADSPAHEDDEDDIAPTSDEEKGGSVPNPVADLAAALSPTGKRPPSGDEASMPDFSHYSLDDDYDEDYDEDEGEGESADYGFASLADYLEAPVKKAVDLEGDEFDPADYEVDADEAPAEIQPATAQDAENSDPAVSTSDEDEAHDPFSNKIIAEPEGPALEEPDTIGAPVQPETDPPAEAVQRFDGFAGPVGLHNAFGRPTDEASTPEARSEVQPDTQPEAEFEAEAETEAEPATQAEPTVDQFAAGDTISESEADSVSDPIATMPETPVSERTPPASDPGLASVEEPSSPGRAESTSPDLDLQDCLAAARALARSARASEDRSRQALYAAVGRAYDFSLAAKARPDDYEKLLQRSGLTGQDRAPMTPVVKLVFGADYDKTRVTEYSAVLSHAQRLDLEHGSLARFLSEAEGGLKGVVQAERRLRREENGEEVEPEDTIRAALAEKLRELEALTLDALADDGPEFALVMVRRDNAGIGSGRKIAVLGEVEADIGTIERAAKRLVG